MADTYTENDITRRLSSELPEWSYRDGYLSRTYDTGDWRRTSLLSGAIAYFAEAAFHHPDLVMGFSTLAVRLRSHDVDGITGRDFDLAARIEETARWRPGEASALSGPNDEWIR